MILHTRQHAQLALDRHAVRMCQLDDLAGQLDVLLIRQAAAVDHHGGVAAVNAGFHALDALAVIQMQRNRHGAVFAVSLHRVTNALCADFLRLDRAVHEVQFSAHKGVGSLRALQNRAGMQQLVNTNRRLNLPYAVHVKRALAIAIFVRRRQNRSHRYEHIVHLICKFVP